MNTVREQQASAMREFLEQYLQGLITFAELQLQLANFQVYYEREQAAETL